MKKVTYYGKNTVSFEGFSKACERSCEGALFFMPNQQKRITDGEYEHILSKYPHEVINLEVHKNPMDEKILLGKRKGAANSVSLRDPNKAKQFDGNKLHLEKAKSEVPSARLKAVEKSEKKEDKQELKKKK